MVKIPGTGDVTVRGRLVDRRGRPIDTPLQRAVLAAETVQIAKAIGDPAYRPGVILNATMAPDALSDATLRDRLEVDFGWLLALGALPTTLAEVDRLLGGPRKVAIDDVLAWTPRPESTTELQALVEDWDRGSATGWATVVADGRELRSSVFSQSVHFLVARGISRWMLDHLYEPQQRAQLEEATEHHIADWLAEESPQGHSSRVASAYADGAARATLARAVCIDQMARHRCLDVPGAVGPSGPERFAATHAATALCFFVLDLAQRCEVRRGNPLGLDQHAPAMVRSQLFLFIQAREAGIPITEFLSVHAGASMLAAHIAETTRAHVAGP